MDAELSFAHKPTLTGDQLVLRPVRVTDAPALARAMADPHVRRLTGSHARFSLGDLEKWYASREEHADRLDLAIVERATAGCVGEVVLNNLDADNRSCGFRIALFHPGFFGRGWGTEATRMILAHAFDAVGVYRIELEVYAFNPRARRVYDKVGFVYEGTKRGALLWNEEPVDVDIMGMLADEWTTHRGHPRAGLDKADDHGPL